MPARARKTPRPARLPAKLSPPRLAVVHPRERLFARLDGTGNLPLAWVAGPAGAGKTTLAASHLAARGLEPLWYRLDVRDADPAAFFFYLREAVRARSPCGRETLPLLTPEYREALPAFAQTFFEEAFARLRPGTVLVLDEYEQLPPEAPLHALLAQALSSLPEGVGAMVLSRVDPPAPYARLEASGALAVFRGEDLALSLDEARGIARLREGAEIAVATVSEVHERARGWAAGFVLLLESARAGGERAPGAGPAPRARQPLFDYFAAELLSRVEPAARGLLLRVALVEQPSADLCAALTGDPGAGAELERLAARNTFTQRLGGGEARYQLHPLFREFLRERARAELSEDEHRATCRIAARHQRERGSHEEAAELFAAAGDWRGLADLVLAEAEPLVRAGRHATLRAWVRSLPADQVDADPWLQYWAGVAETFADIARAERHLARALQRFLEARDGAGTGLAWAALVDLTLATFRSLTGLAPWLDRVEPVLQGLAFPSTEIEARAVAAMVLTMTWRCPTRERIAPWTRRLRRLLDAAAEPRLRIEIGDALVFYDLWIGDVAAAAEVSALTRTDVRDGLPPRIAGNHAGLGEATLAHFVLDGERLRRVIEQGVAQAEASGAWLGLVNLLAMGAYGALNVGDLGGAAAYLERMRPLAEGDAPLSAAQLEYTGGWLAFERGDLAEAARRLRVAVRLCEQGGAVYPRAQCALLLAEALGASRDPEAAALLAEVETVAADMQSSLLGSMVRLSRAWLALAEGDRAGAMGFLREGLHAMREAGLLGFPGWHDRRMGELALAALEDDVETAFVGQLVRQHRLLPPPEGLDAEKWPWPVRIHALGGFSVAIDGAPLRFEGKAQPRPLELLKAILAAGGRGISKDAVAERLWPDADGDAAQFSFTANLGRLRKLLGHPEAMALTEGKVSLDPRRCWVDAWAFERQLARAEGEADPERLSQAARRLLDLYRGPFLAETDAAWALGPRERLRQQFLRALGEIAGRLGRAGRCEDVVRLYQRGCEIDEVAEDLYHGLMACYAAHGRNVEARATFERARRILAARLGVAPSARLVALYQDARNDDPVERSRPCAHCRAGAGLRR